jgi:hypothetical protein
MRSVRVLPNVALVKARGAVAAASSPATRRGDGEREERPGLAHRHSVAKRAARRRDLGYCGRAAAAGRSIERSLIGNYLIEERLGTGGMGAVYRAFDQPAAATGQAAAAEHRRRHLLHASARAGATRLNHPSIVHIYDIVETDEATGSSWSWSGKTLDRMLRDGLARCVQLARGLPTAWPRRTRTTSCTAT